MKKRVRKTRAETWMSTRTTKRVMAKANSTARRTRSSVWPCSRSPNACPSAETRSQRMVDGLRGKCTRKPTNPRIPALGFNTRTFNRVFAMAQNILRNTFGMELVELRSRAELDKDAAAPATQNQDDLDEARKATGVKKKSRVRIASPPRSRPDTTRQRARISRRPKNLGLEKAQRRIERAT
ncbi:hypothetical protein K438DRAFT_1800650 [Mycena galopus ATCC 62051]|nr:hypothetical protein K438DRAFT_1800650 [Mycena galopus ATCC 62051]